MTKEAIAHKKIPDTPGVYFFIGPRKEILYIGKATSLKNRVRSYFSADLKTKRSQLIENMVAEAKTVEWTQTDSTLEALILEANLIRTHKPRFNTRTKDDKSYNHLIITDEDWPRVLVVRGKDMIERSDTLQSKYEFGPFPNSQLFKEALKIVRKLFRFYDTREPIGAQKNKVVQGRIDFNRQIGLYPKHTDHAEYVKTIRQLRLFFEGKKQQLLHELRADMMQYAALEKFEQAHEIKKKIFALEHIQDVALLRDDTRIYRDDRQIRIEAYDVAHIAGEHMVGVMVVLEGEQPRKSEYRKFTVKTITTSNDPAALAEILDRRLRHTEWPYPQLIVVDGSTAQKRAAERVLRAHAAVIPVVSVVKNDHHKPERLLATKQQKEQFESLILLANAEAHRFALSFHRTARRKKLTSS